MRTMHHKHINRSIHIRPKVTDIFSHFETEFSLKNVAPYFDARCWLQWFFLGNIFAPNFDVAICQAVDISSVRYFWET